MNPWRSLGGLPRGLWILFATTLVNRAGTMVMPFLALWLTQTQGFSAERAGQLLAFYGLGSIVAAPASGWLSDRIAPHRVMEASLILSGLAVLLLPAARGFFTIAGLVFLWSVLAEFFRPASLLTIHELAPPDKTRTAVALQRLAINLGMSTGPAVGGFLVLYSFKSVFVVDGVTSILAGLVMLSAAGASLRALPRVQAANGALTRSGTPVWADRGFLFFLLAMIPSCCVFFQLQSTLAIFLVRDLGLAPSVYGLLFTVNTLLIVAIEVPLTAWISRHPIRWSTATGGVLLACGFGGMALIRGLPGAIVCTVLWTFGEMLLLPALVTQAGVLAPPERRGEYMGAYGLGINLTAVLGPWVGMGLLEHHGARTLWTWCLVAGLLSAGLMWRVREPIRVRS
ncbi:MAG: MFS transporter, partial [Acidobacteriota bacterium]